MKKINLIEWLSRNSHEKQKPQRFARYAAMLIMLLTLGVGQMWAYNIGGGTIYVDNYGMNWSSIRIYMWGNNNWSTDWTFTQIPGTDYWQCETPGTYGMNGYKWAEGAAGSWEGGQSSDITADGAQSSWHTKCYDLKNGGWKTPGLKNVSYVSTTAAANVLAGNGGSSTPYIVKPGTSISVQLSGDLIDSECTKSFKFGDAAASITATKTVVASAVKGTAYSMEGFTGSTRSTYSSRYASAGTIYFKTAYNISASVSGGHGTVSITSGGSYVYSGNTSFLVTASPDTGYEVNTWSVSGGTKTGTGNTITVTASNSADCSITVTYKACQYSTTNNVKESDGTTNAGTYKATYDATSISYTTKPSKTGYHIYGLYKEKGLTNQIVSGETSLNASTSYTTTASKWNQTSAPDLFVKWEANTYQVHFNGNGNDGGSMSNESEFTYDVAKTLTLNGFTKTGYHFYGWATTKARADSKTRDYTDGQSVSNLTSTNGGTAELWAIWEATNYTVTLNIDEANHGTIAGKATSASVTFDAAPTAIAAGQLPTAAQGYAFMGFFTAAGGNGRRFIDPSGAWVAEAGDTISGGHWVKPEGITLYAYYKKAEITALTLDNAVVAPSASVGVTPTVAPTPTGTNSICWKLLYSNGNLYSPQPTFSPASPAGISNKVTFTAPLTSGTYLIAAVLRTGNECNGGTKLDSVTSAFQVAGDHTVTVQYKDAEGNTLQASGTVNGRPLVWTEVVAHDIFGYTFSGWTAGDGITLEDAESGRLEDLQAEDETIVAVTKMKAIYDGRLTANYAKKDFIYFKSTALGWNDVYVYFYTDGGYWNESNGAGATGGACLGKGKMELVPGETDIYYWDYGAGIRGGASAATKYVAFTWGDCTNHEHFNGKSSCYPMNGNNQGFSSGTPMFVPISQDVNYRKNNNATPYYDRGYWTKYAGGTGYSVDIFFTKGGSHDKSINFEEGETAGMPFTATAYLSGGTTLGFKIHRSSGLYYYSSTDVNMSNASTAKSLTYDVSSNNQTGITTNVTGEYTFTLTCGSDGRLNVTVKYPAAAGDYRLVYSDGVQTKPLVSDVVPQVNGGKDTVSFFVRPGSTPVLKIQRASVSAGVLSWSDYSPISSRVSGLAATGVYNICLQMDGSGAISVENVEAYTGEFYIRTDAANNKWDNYRAADHLMTYSEYSETYSDFTHYFVAHVESGNNVKFVVANDYSPNISDTLEISTYRGGDGDHIEEGGNIKANANVRFMWDRRNNAVYRAYLDEAKSDGSRFLVLRANSSEDLMDENGNALTSGNNHGAPDNSIQFVDNENWIYETNVKVKPSAYVKLYGHFHDQDFYFKGESGDDFNGEDGDSDGIANAIQLMTGTGEAQKVRVIYDFKTDRLLAAWMPSGRIDGEHKINADVMFVREGQGDIAQLVFVDEDLDGKFGSITAIKSAYGVMRFNKWTLNNKEKTGTHTVLSSPASIYERSLFWISFPFRVKLSEVFGFGTYGVDWAIQRYDGAERAEKGFWAESSGFWKWMDRNTEYLEPDQGYLLAIDLDLLGESASVWNNGVENVELYFPSYGAMPSITSADVEHTLPSHACTIDWSGRSNGNGGTLGSAYNRTVIDSHWNVMSVPTYVNTSSVSFTNHEDWITGGDGKHGPNFLYTWNASDNTLTPNAGAGYHYHAMHAYMVQYHGDVTWTASSGSPYSPIVARRTYAEQPKKVNFCLEIQQNDKMLDRTFVQLSDDEEVSAEFSFGEDMGKEFNSRKANIYTVIEGYLPAAGNTLPMSDQTTLVPVGVKTTAAGEYTFAMPDGTNGVSVVLIDNIAGTRTNLALSDYTVALGKGDLSDRFMLEIAPIKQMPTDIENVQGDDVQGAKARKVMVDGILYIVKDGKVFDARGAKVK